MRPLPLQEGSGAPASLTQVSEGRARVLLLAMLVLGFFLRVYRLGEQSLWYDEAFSFLLAQRDTVGVIQGATKDTLPPLYLLFMHGWSLLGSADFFLRFPSVVFGLLGVALIYAVARELFGARVGVMAVLLAELSPFQVYYSQEGRMYAMLGFLSLLALYTLLKAWRGGGARWWLGYAAAGSLALYTHTLAGLTLLAFSLGALGALRPFPLRRLLVASAGAALLFAPWLLVLWGQAMLVQRAFWSAPPSVVSPLASLYVFFFNAALPTTLVPVGLGLVLFLAGLASLMGLRRREREVHFVLAWLFFPGVGALLFSLVRPIYLERALLPASFALYLLLAWGFFALRPRPVVMALVGAVLALELVGLAHWYWDPAYAKPPLRAAAQHVGRGWQPGDMVLHTSDGSYLPFLLYLPQAQQRLLYGDPEYFAGTVRANATYRVLGFSPHKLEEAVSGQRPLWLVVALDHSQAFQLEALDRVHQAYPLEQEATFRAVLVRLYRLP